MSKHTIWAEKYAPTSLQDYAFHDSHHESQIKQMLSDKTIPHLLFTGPAGNGKTTLANLIIKALDVDSSDVLFINASDENSIDTMRDKIKSFISTLPFGDFKVVFMDEADGISLQGQKALRAMMNEYAETARFILTGNYENKFIPPIRSRIQHFRFKAHSQDDITESVAKILLKEKIKFDLDLLDKYVTAAYPDIRKTINLVQQHSIGGELQAMAQAKEAGDYKFKLLELLEVDNWKQARVVVCENVIAEEWEDLYRFLYENIDKSKKFKAQDKWEQAIVVIAEHLDKHGHTADAEINAAAMFIRLGQI